MPLAKQDNKIVAQLKATLWRDDYLRINRNFLKLLNSPLQDGITMLFCARITFDAVHGLALRIIDIDPVFSLGELEREKQESISRLTDEGIFDCNKALAFPLLPKRLTKHCRICAWIAPISAFFGVLPVPIAQTGS